MKKKCTICGGTFTPGVDGILNPVAHDKCVGVERDKDGSVWWPDEIEQKRVRIHDGFQYVVTREQAFSVGDIVQYQ